MNLTLIIRDYHSNVPDSINDSTRNGRVAIYNNVIGAS